MRTTWASWKPDEMLDAAAAEARTDFDALAAPTRHFVPVLPYFGAYAEYEDHVAVCAACKADEFADCPTGAALFHVARAGLEEQRRLAAHN